MNRIVFLFFALIFNEIGLCDVKDLSALMDAGEIVQSESIERSWTFSASSDNLLQSCWTPQELQARPGERKIKMRLPVDAAPPEKTVPEVVNPNPMPGIARSIRSVKPHNGEKLVALTFDLCEKSNEVTGYDGELIDTLRAEGVHATFYAGGKWMRSHPERTMQLMADPLFELGNHAWTHGNLRVLRAQEVEDQIQWTQAQYEILRTELLNRPCATALPPHQTHTIPASLATFRFPYGTCNAESLNQVARAGLYPIQWDVVTGDPARAQTADLIVKEVLNRVRPGSIVIAHANGRGRHTAEAMKTLIPALQARGYRFVTVSDLLSSGEVVSAETCYEQRPGDNQRYDRLFGGGTQ
jgi:peptidoglycan-N-acetylglucosamine deacetylase